MLKKNEDAHMEQAVLHGNVISHNRQSVVRRNLSQIIKYYESSCCENQPVLPQNENPKRPQSINASHIRDVIVMQVQENKMLHIRQMLDLGDQIVLKVQKLQFLTEAQLREFLQKATE